MNQNTENKLIFAKLRDKIKYSKTRNKIVNTEFLNMYQQKLIQGELQELRITNYIFYGGFQEAENRILIIYPIKMDEEIIQNSIDNIIGAIKITLPNDLTGKYEHRDYLSTLMRLGLERERIGDIIVYEKEAYIVVLKENAEYIKNSLHEFTKFKKSKIETINMADIKSKSPDLKNIEIHVASNRLDSIVAEIAKTSRSKAEELIKSEKVSINYQYEYKNCKQVNIGDILIVRGSGKYIIDEIKENPRTKKLIITLKKYM